MMERENFPTQKKCLFLRILHMKRRFIINREYRAEYLIKWLISSQECELHEKCYEREFINITINSFVKSGQLILLLEIFAGLRWFQR